MKKQYQERKKDKEMAEVKAGILKSSESKASAEKEKEKEKDTAKDKKVKTGTRIRPGIRGRVGTI